MRSLRLRLIALVVAVPLFLIAFVGWLLVDDRVMRLETPTAGGSMPWWQVAETAMNACLPVVVIGLILAALVVAVRRARRRRTWAAADNVAAAAIAVIGPATFFSAFAGGPDSRPAHPAFYLLALLVGVLVGIAILANAAARAQADRRAAGPVAVPAAMLSIVLLAALVAVVVYTAYLVVHGVPLADPTFGVRIYPIDALPSGYAGWLSALIVSMVASLAALSTAIYGTVGAIRGVQLKTTPAVNIVIDLDIASSCAHTANRARLSRSSDHG
jgi:hypothetical protein